MLLCTEEVNDGNSLNYYNLSETNSFIIITKPIIYTKQAEELIRALSDLEHSASSDAAVRERIAALPTEVSDVSMLEKLTGKYD